MEPVQSLIFSFVKTVHARFSFDVEAPRNRFQRRTLSAVENAPHTHYIGVDIFNEGYALISPTKWLKLKYLLGSS